MHRLVIPVKDNIAALWQNAAPEQRVQIINIFCWLLEKEQWQQFTPATFSVLLDQISDKAMANGLTPEMLDEMLHGQIAASRPANGKGIKLENPLVYTKRMLKKSSANQAAMTQIMARYQHFNVDMSDFIFNRDEANER